MSNSASVGTDIYVLYRVLTSNATTSLKVKQLRNLELALSPLFPSVAWLSHLIPLSS